MKITIIFLCVQKKIFLDITILPMITLIIWLMLESIKEHSTKRKYLDKLIFKYNIAYQTISNLELMVGGQLLQKIIL